MMTSFELMKADRFFEDLMINYGMLKSVAHYLNMAILCALIAILAFVMNFVVKKIIIKIIKRWVDKSTNNYDDIFYEKGVFNKLSQLAPALIIAWLAPLVLIEFPVLIKLIKTAANIYMVVVVLMVINSVINAFQEIYNQLPMAKNRSIKGYVQVVKTIVYFVGSLMVISILVSKDLSSLFAGLTAFAAVLMFVFKDTILGLIAGIQISSNDILRVGDYIEMPSKNIDGNVVDIRLSTVKILNTNKTISTIPTYAFVSESFWNWRGLEISEGRRIKRFINIDLSSIKYCNAELLEKLRKVGVLKDFFAKNDAEFNKNPDSKWEGKQYTNATIYRAYIESYLRNNPEINSEMNLMVRHLQPAEHGLPIEIYAYTKEKVGPKYELIQSAIFEHIIAIAPEFEIKLFQDPTGNDVRNN